MSNIVEEGGGERATKRRRENDQNCSMEVTEKVEILPPEIWTRVIECEFIYYSFGVIEEYTVKEHAERGVTGARRMQSSFILVYYGTKSCLHYFWRLFTN